MLRRSRPSRRRPRSSHVVKYLEGVPSPRSLLDQLAGADLVSGANRATHFFSTVPRYLDCKHEHRLSRLFFHHVLYPAGGARKPTQAVVVRGGRSVVPCRPRRVAVPKKNVSVGVNSGAVRDPLAVPASQLGSGPPSSSPPPSFNGSNSAGCDGCGGDGVLFGGGPCPTDATFFSPEQSHYNSSHWSRSDAARAAYFYAPHTSRNEDSHKGYQFRNGAPSVLTAPPLRYERAMMMTTDNNDGNNNGGGGESKGSSRQQQQQQRRASPLSSFPPMTMMDRGGDGEGGQGRVRGHASPTATAATTYFSLPQRERATTDEALAGLRGVIEGAFLAKPRASSSSSFPFPSSSSSSSPLVDAAERSSAALAKIASLVANSSAGLVLLAPTQTQGGVRGVSEMAVQHAFRPAAAAPSANTVEATGDGGGGSSTAAAAAAAAAAVATLIADACRQQTRAPKALSRGGGVAPFTAYVQTSLPPEAVVSLPILSSSSSSRNRNRGPLSSSSSSSSSLAVDEFLCHLAGGVEPSVHFAVGAPLVPPPSSSPMGAGRVHPSSSATVEGNSDSRSTTTTTVSKAAVNPFPHISCLLRIEGTAPPLPPPLATNAAADAAAIDGGGGGGSSKKQNSTDNTKNASSNRKVTPTRPLEPWRLGGPALDPAVPYTARTVSEASAASQQQRQSSSNSNSSSALLLLGRADCETYLLPQRELLLTLHVPPDTQRLCEEQNSARLARQVKLGHSAAAVTTTTTTTRMCTAVHDKKITQQQKEQQQQLSTGSFPRRSFLSPSLTPVTTTPTTGGGGGGDGSASMEESKGEGEEDDAVAAAFGFMLEPATSEDYGATSPAGDRRTTSSQIARRRHSNEQAAMMSSSSLTTGSLSSSSSGGGGGGGGGGNEKSVNALAQQQRQAGKASLPSSPSPPPLVVTYEVRALPGDVVFIPTGWAYAVRRIVGTALIDMAAAAAAAATAAPASSHTHLYSSRSLAFSSKTIRPPTTRTTTPSHPSHAPPLSNREIAAVWDDDSRGQLASPTAATAAVTVSGVAVDALLLNYRPYPHLSREQAAVYISANYVHGGVEEFYEKGGNPLFYKYE